MDFFVKLIQAPRIGLIFGSWGIGLNLNLFGSSNIHYTFHWWSASPKLWRVSFKIIFYLLQYTKMTTLVRLKSWDYFAASCLFTMWRVKSWGLKKKDYWIQALFLDFPSLLIFCTGDYSSYQYRKIRDIWKSSWIQIK